MKIHVIVGSLLLSSSVAFGSGQEADQPSADKVDVAGQAKTYTPAKEGWLVRYDEAVAQSQKTGKPIMAAFTGSDSSGWCMRLTNEVFSKPEFKQWAEKNVVLWELDFPRGIEVPMDIKKQNWDWQKGLHVTGYPTVFVFNVIGNDPTLNHVKLLARTGYHRGGVEVFLTKIETMMKMSQSESGTDDTEASE